MSRAGWGLFVLAVLVVAATLGGPVLSGDLWWHLSSGRWMLDQGALPKVDPFSFTAGDTPWILQEYGSQILFAWIEGLGGMLGIRVFGALVAAALLACVLVRARRELEVVWAAAAAALFAGLFALKWELRPHLLSAFFVLGFEALVVPRARATGRTAPTTVHLIGVALGACLWVQLHAEAMFAPIFALGLLLASAFGAAIGIDRPSDGSNRWKRPTSYLLLFGAALTGTLLSPLGIEPHRYALFGRSVPRQYIEEWFPGWVSPGDPRFAPFNLALFGLVTVGFVVTLGLALFHAVALMRRRTQLPVERLAFLAICLVMAFEARRFLWLLWFPLLEVLVLLARTGTARRVRIAPLALGLGALAILVSTHYPRGAWRNLVAGRFHEATDRELFPVGSADVLEEIEFRGNLYHPYEWGGYLGARLWPNARVFLDARTVLFEEIIPERWLAERDPAYGRQVFERRDVSAIVFKRLVNRDGRTVAWRPPNPDVDWIRGYADSAGVLWIRQDRANSLKALEQYFATLGIPFDVQTGFVELAAWVANPDWAERARVLPEVVAKSLAGEALSRARSGTASAMDWLELSERAFAVRMGRSARFAMGRALDSAALPPATRDKLRAQLTEGPVPEMLAILRQALG